MSAIDKNNSAGRRRIRLILLVIIIFLTWTTITVLNQWFDIRDIKKEVVMLQEEEGRKLAIKTNLEREVLMLKNYEYIAEIARKYYFLSKPGEIIIISPED